MLYAHMLIMLLCTLLCLAQASALDEKPWLSRAMSPEDRARALLSVMTLQEKIAMLHGYNSPNYTGLTLGNARLSIPPLNMNDGRQGFRPNDRNSEQTAFPCELSTVATFDKELFYQFGEAMGEEFAGKGGNVMLAPMLILARVPQGGRNFESTGECPELAYHFANHMIKGVQSVPGVIANADDFVLSAYRLPHYFHLPYHHFTVVFCASYPLTRPQYSLGGR
jgi:beta-glucosidase